MYRRPKKFFSYKRKCIFHFHLFVYAITLSAVLYVSLYVSIMTTSIVEVEMNSIKEHYKISSMCPSRILCDHVYKAYQGRFRVYFIIYILQKMFVPQVLVCCILFKIIKRGLYHYKLEHLRICFETSSQEKFQSIISILFCPLEPCCLPQFMYKTMPLRRTV